MSTFLTRNVANYSRDVFFDEGQGIRDRVHLELDPTPSPSPPAAEPAPLKTETPKDEDSEDDNQVEAILDDSDQESDHTPPQPLSPPPPEPRRSTRSRTAPIHDDDNRYLVSSYQRKTPAHTLPPGTWNDNSVGDSDKEQTYFHCIISCDD